jgi:hypothetical protein
MQHQAHPWVALLERGDRPRQRVARLRVRGGDRQGALLLVGEFLSGALQVAGFGEDALGDREHGLARLGDRGDALAVAHENLHAELVLEALDLLGDAGLGGMQGLGGGRDAQTAAHHLAGIA